jgi:hypothetical protein
MRKFFYVGPNTWIRRNFFLSLAGIPFFAASIAIPTVGLKYACLLVGVGLTVAMNAFSYGFGAGFRAARREQEREAAAAMAEILPEMVAQASEDEDVHPMLLHIMREAARQAKEEHARLENG